MKIIIESDTIKALLLAAGKGDRRTMLNSICLDVRAHDAVAVATQGHLLLAVPVEVEPTESSGLPYVVGEYVIPRAALDGIKASKGAAFILTIDPAARTVSIEHNYNFTTVKLIDEKYPEWRRVVPLTVSGLVAQFSPDYVATFGKIHKLLGGKYSPTILHNGDGKGSGGSARIVLANNAVGVLMPVRYDPQPIDNPSWLDREPVSQTAAA